MNSSSPSDNKGNLNKCPCLVNDHSALVSNTSDGRKKYDWASGYPKEARKEMRFEALFLFLLFFASLLILYLTWKGWFSSWLFLSQNEATALRKIVIFTSAGMLGGIIFGIKHFYRLVGRGYWHQDRRYWRIMSPFTAMGIALVVGAMFDASIINIPKPISEAWLVSIGFLTGYFADQAVGKMAEVAELIFGSPTYGGDRKVQDGK